jgi:hypothetical protein
MMYEFTRLKDDETQQELLELLFSKEDVLDVLYGGGIVFFSFLLVTFFDRLTLLEK